MPIPSKGVPSIKTTDGPNGARGEFFTNGTPVSTPAWRNHESELIVLGCIVPMRHLDGVIMERGLDGGNRPASWRGNQSPRR